MPVCVFSRRHRRDRGVCDHCVDGVDETSMAPRDAIAARFVKDAGPAPLRVSK